MPFIAARMASVSLPQPPSLASCSSILAEILQLVGGISTLNETSQVRLNFLLSNYFQDDVHGAAFRSVLYTGREGEVVSLEEFNQFVIWPNTDCQLQLVTSTTVSVPQPLRQCKIVDKSSRSHLVRLSRTRALLKVDFILNQLAQHHPCKADIHRNSYKHAPISWKESILGISGRAKLRQIAVPNFKELESRLKIFLEFTSAQKEKVLEPSILRTTESGSAWSRPPVNPPVPPALVDHSINYAASYLNKACSDFPGHLECLLHESNMMLDEHAGIEVTESYPEV
jgi:hypothetical protein